MSTATKKAKSATPKASGKAPRARNKVPPAASKAFDTLAVVLSTPAPPAAGKRVRKGSTAPAAKPEFAARLIDATKAIHVILEADRPKKSPALQAHTHAVLTSLGMLSKGRPAIREATVATMFGAVAIRHHVSMGNMERTRDGKVRLTPEGLTKFAARALAPGFDTGLAQAYVDMFVAGKIAPVLGIKPTQVYEVGVSL